MEDNSILHENISIYELLNVVTVMVGQSLVTLRYFFGHFQIEIFLFCMISTTFYSSIISSKECQIPNMFLDLTIISVLY
jgi:hypothetical protein